jgi:hypothetical protein
MKININKIKYISFTLCTLVSIDLIQFGGLRLTLVPMFFYGLITILRSQKIDKNIYFVCLFTILCVPSLLNSYNLPKSAGYLIWIIFNFVSISIPFKRLYLINSQATIDGLMLGYRLQIVIGALFFLSGFQARAHVFYYEPSYFALALVPYVVFIINDFVNNKRKHVLDIFLVIIALYTTKSANLMFVSAIGFATVFIMGGVSFRKLIYVAIISILSIAGLYIYATNSDDLVAKTIYNLFNSANLFNAATERTGNRWYRAALTFETSFSTFWGVGIGAFIEYSTSKYFPAFSGLPDYLSPIGFPPINIYFEIIATCGWLAFIVWIIWHFKMIKSASSSSIYSPFIIAAFITAMLALSIESNFLRPYYWMLIGLIIGEGKNSSERITEK